MERVLEIESESDYYWMEFALEEAKLAKLNGEVPVGSIIISNNRIVGQGRNSPVSRNDPTSHAEINAIRDAATKTGNYRLTDTILYVTLEPCAMCYGAIIHSRISRLVFGAFDPKTGVCGSSIKLHKQICFNHTPQITGGVLEEECSLLLKNFFNERRS